MKKILFLMIVALTVAGCSKEEKEKEIDFREVSPSEIIGDWGAKNRSYYEYYTFYDTKNGKYTKFKEPAHSSLGDESYTFEYKIEGLMMYYTEKNGNEHSIGIGLYKWGNLMVGSKEYSKLD